MSSEHFSQSVSGADALKLILLNVFEGGCHSGSPLSVEDRSQTIMIGIRIHQQVLRIFHYKCVFVDTVHVKRHSLYDFVRC